MLDVLHYYFEEDIDYESEERADARSRVRSRIFEEMYDRPYRYARRPQLEPSAAYSEIEDGASDPDWLSEAEEREITPFQPKKKPTIPYSPPSNVDIESELPFGFALDAPMQ